ncbi:MAG: DUF3108 domain-containing protein [Candidatus Aminicenantia bacterium]
MKFIKEFLLIYFFISCYLFSQAFLPYEFIRFKVKWAFINAGWAELELKQTEEEGVYHLRLDAESSGIISSIFDVDDHAESWIDNNICSKRYIKNQKEGRWVSDEDVLFDYNKKKIIFEIKKRKQTGEIEEKREEIDLGSEECLQDMVSSFYYFRTLDIKEGKIFKVPTFDRGKVFITEVSVLRREKILTELGEFEAYILQPISKLQGAFRTRKGKMWIWLSADGRKIPLKIKAKFTFGSVSMEIIYYQSGDVFLTPQKTGLP